NASNPPDTADPAEAQLANAPGEAGDTAARAHESKAARAIGQQIVQWQSQRGRRHADPGWKGGDTWNGGGGTWSAAELTVRQVRHDQRGYDDREGKQISRLGKKCRPQAVNARERGRIGGEPVGMEHT